MLKDLRFGLRMLRKSPGFTLMAVVALALGIGANTAIFSAIDAVMLRRLPFQDLDRLAMVWEESPRTGKPNVVNPVNFLRWRERNHSFDRLAALIEFDASLTGEGEPEVISNLAVSRGYFEILGVSPLAGRWFSDQEDTPGNDRVAVLSEALWRRRYGADPSIVGRKIQVNNATLVVVGVMPAGFQLPLTKAELWQPLALDPAKNYPGRYLSTIGRLRSGATIATAQSEMSVIAAQLQKERPDYDSKWGISVIGLREQAIGSLRTPLLILLGAVGFVLLIACANVANLMLMRAAGRGREIAVRTALGASALRIARQLLAESMLIALVGGALGLFLGAEAMRIGSATLPDTAAYASLKAAHLNLTVFLFTAVVSIAGGILFGLAPAFTAVRLDLQEALRTGGRGATDSRGIARRILVVAEVALSMMLLIGAGLLIRSFGRLTSVDPGFEADRVLSMQLAVSGRFSNSAKLLQFVQQALDRVRAIPSVEAAGTSHFLPLGRIVPGTGFWRTDQPRPKHGEEPVTDVLVVMPGYFAAMKTPLVRGRVFDTHDASGSPHAVVINQSLARAFYPNEDPVGKMLTVQWGPDPYQIVGVVGDVRQRALDRAAKSEVFICNLQEPTSPIFLVARTHGNPRALASAIESEIHALDKDMPIADVRSMDEYVSDSVAAPRFNTILLTAFAALALVLSSVGIFGVIAYSVGQRTQEIGIRRALGADSASVMRMVVGQGLVLAVIGILTGVGGALTVTRVLTTLLFEVTPSDPLTFAAVATVLAVVALAASYLPARRASRIDPMEALRRD